VHEDEVAAVVSIDLNCDLGEGFGAWRMGDDVAMLDVVTSANVACGFHAGDAPTMRRTCDAAVARGVTIGAHVSYHDLVGFGRRDIDITAADLRDEILYQIGALDAFCRAAGAAVRYVKPHGALYHRTHTDEGQAGAVVDAICDYDPNLGVLGAPGSQLLRASVAAGLRVATEGFADRAYRADGSLVPRNQPGAVHESVETIASQALSIARDRTVVADDGRAHRLHVESICLHGDTPGAASAARRVRDELSGAGVHLRTFIQ
jgi:UPF0271 protein